MSEKTEEKRRRIIDAGLLLFARYGIRNTTLTAIAARARLAKPTLYYYFPEGKETIFSLAVRRVVDELFARFEREVAEADLAIDKLRIYMYSRVRAFDRELTTRGVEPEVWEELKLLAWRVLEPYLEAELSLIEAIVAQGVEEGTFRDVDPRTVARVIQAAIKGVTADAPINVTPAQRTRQLDAMFGLFTRGLLPLDGSEPGPRAETPSDSSDSESRSSD